MATHDVVREVCRVTSRMNMTVLLITGMHSNQCREEIAAAIESVPGVKQVDVSLFRAAAAVMHDDACKSQELIQAVVAAGYGATFPGKDESTTRTPPASG